MNWKELVEWFKKLGVDEVKAEKLAYKIKEKHYMLVINPETAEIGSGGQYFGSGGYWHSYGIHLPKGYKYLSELENDGYIDIINTEDYYNGFVGGTWYTIKVLKKPLVISHSQGDGIGSGRRWRAEVYVWY